MPATAAAVPKRPPSSPNLECDACRFRVPIRGVRVSQRRASAESYCSRGASVAIRPGDYCDVFASVPLFNSLTISCLEIIVAFLHQAATFDAGATFPPLRHGPCPRLGRHEGWL